MKRPKDNIFKLIRSMSPAEKRYLKRHYASENNLLTDLFNLVNSMDEYNEEVVKEKFKNTNLAKNLKVYKIQLVDLILKSLVSYYSKKSVVSKIRVGLEEVDVLFEKQLHDIASERLARLRQLCEQYQLYSYLLEVEQKAYFISHVQIDQVGLSQHPFFEAIPACLEALKVEFEMTKLSNAVFDKFRKDYQSLPDEDKQAYIGNLIKNQLLLKDDNELSFRAKLSKYTLLSLIYKMNGETWKEYGSKRDSLNLFEASPEFKKVLPFQYMGVLRNNTNVSLASKKYEELGVLLGKAEEFAKEMPYTKHLLVYFYFSSLKGEFENGHFEQINKNLENKIVKHIKQYDQQGDRIAVLIYHFLTINSLVLKKYKKAQQYIDILVGQSKDFDGYFLESIHVLELISLVETDDDSVVEAKLRSYRRKIRGQEQEVSPVYLRLLKLFKQLVNAPYKRSQLAKDFLDEKSSYQPERVNYILSYFKLDCWFYALAEKITLRQAMNDFPGKD